MHKVIYSVASYDDNGDLKYDNFQGFSNVSAAREWMMNNSGSMIDEHLIPYNELTLNLPLKTLVCWKNLDGKEHYGWLKEYDNGTAIVLVDGREVSVRAS